MLAQAVRFSTHEVSEAQRCVRWEEWNRRALIGLDCRTPQGRGLRGEEVTLELPSFTLGRVRAAPHEVSRSARTVHDSPADCAVVYAVLRGRSTLSVGSRSLVVEGGDVVMVDADRPFERSFPTGFAELALKVPRTFFDQYHAATTHAGAGVIRASGLAALRVRALGRHVADSVLPLVPADAETVSTVATDLLTDLTTRESLGDRLALAQLLIEQHLGDPLLSASRLAAALELSQRQLSRLFGDAQTSFPKYLTDRRLLRADALLRRPGTLPVGDIAARCGFSSAAYFSRVFRDRHGTSPGQFRAS